MTDTRDTIDDIYGTAHLTLVPLANAVSSSVRRSASSVSVGCSQQDCGQAHSIGASRLRTLHALLGGLD
jgi:hypothetical protein